jgi:Na+-driven multidrug efflux pump
MDALDRRIIGTALPSMVNLAVVPIVNAVDTFWVGRMGVALALAGQGAANQAFFTLFFLVNYLPTITAPLVATAVGLGDVDLARRRVCESIFLSSLLGACGTILLCGFPRVGLAPLLDAKAPAMEYAVPYLRVRALSLVPALIGSTGFAAFRGSLDTVTPLKVSLAAKYVFLLVLFVLRSLLSWLLRAVATLTLLALAHTTCFFLFRCLDANNIYSFINLVLDPLLIFFTPFRVVGAAVATAFTEFFSGTVYLKLLTRRKLASIRQILQPPTWSALAPLIWGGATMLGRQAALNLAFICAGRRAQRLDPTGVAAAAYGIVMQLYYVGIVVHVAMQQTAAALVPATRAAAAASGNENADDAARKVGDRMFVWNCIVGLALGVTQTALLPWLVPLFSTDPRIQEVARVPARLSSLMLALNGPVFAGEGIMLGLRCFRDLMLLTSGGVAVMIAGLATPLARRSINGIFMSIIAFTVFQASAVTYYYLKIGPLAVRRPQRNQALQ